MESHNNCKLLSSGVTGTRVTRSQSRLSRSGTCEAPDIRSEQHTLATQYIKDSGYVEIGSDRKKRSQRVLHGARPYPSASWKGSPVSLTVFVLDGDIYASGESREADVPVNSSS